jgi:putative ABC transport system permease protein
MAGFLTAKPASALPLTFRLAGRELRGGLRGFRLFLFCLALGAALIAGVGSLAESVRAGIGRDARALLGGDIELRLLYRPADPAALQAFAVAGRVSTLRTLRAMAKSPKTDERQLVELKAVDHVYPLFGTVDLSPQGKLADVLALRDGHWGAVADRELLERLGIAVGQIARVGSQDYEIRAVIAREPDRGSDAFIFGPRLMVADESLDGTGLVRPGSLIYQVYRIAYAPGLDARAWLASLKQRFPDAGWRIRGLEDAGLGLKRFVDRTALFLTMVGLSALLIGGVGVGNAVRAFLDSKTRTVAILKCLGAPSGAIFAIYLSLIMLLALGGIVIGLAIGAATPFIAAPLLAQGFGLNLALGVYPLALMEAAGFGLLVALAFSLPALMRTRDLPPGQLFRDMVQPARGWRRWSDALLLVLVLAGLIALTILSADDRMLAFWFVLASLATIVVFRLLALAIMRLAGWIARRQSGLGRRALADLAGPGAPTRSVVLSLGLGLTVLVAVASIQGNLRRELADTMPSEAPSFFFIDIQPDQLADFSTLVRAQPGFHELESVPMLRGRIVALKDVPVERLPPPAEGRWVLEGDRGLTWAATPPPGTKLVEGSWWPADYKGAPLISLDSEVAQDFGLKLGDHLTVNLLGRAITGTIANLREVDWTRLSINFVMVFSPGVLESAPQTEIATVRIDPTHEVALERSVTDRFANISAIRVKETLAGVARILDGLSAAVASMAGVALAAGIAVLAGAVLADRRRRIYDAVVLKVLGATRGNLLAGLALEYGFMGLATSLIALLLGSAAAYAFVHWVMEGDFGFLPGVALATAGAGAGLAIFIGLAGTWRALGQKAAPLLRND